MKKIKPIHLQKREKRIRKIRSKIIGSAQKPRLAVYKSNKHIYCQIIDDEKGITLAAASDLEVKQKNKKTKTEISQTVGEKIAQKARTKKIKKVIFDRRGFKFHGRIKALAHGARKSGLVF